ncbi:MAG TPA: glycosyltransferase [Rhodanobacteraceae bacterium]|nr:glycosyltransferase [Rhodanobacteraceae bacterium]
MKPRLSVCIATRNRADFIGETLESILGQCPADVEVMVLDGASTDDTTAVVRRLQQSFPTLRYERQERNGGVDRDYDAAVSLARGEYCWLMSDDDLLKPGAMAAVLQAVDRRRDLIIVNAELGNFDFSRVLDGNRLRFAQDRVYGPSEFNRLFEETSGYLGYIGAVVIRRSLWLSRDRESFFGSCFIHVGVIFQDALPNGAIALATPLIAIRFGNTQWRPREFEIRMIRWTELVCALASIPLEVRERCYPLRPWRSTKSLFFYRAKGTYGIEDYRRWVRPRTSSSLDRAKAWCIARFPGWIANLVGLAVCSLPYRDANVHFLDMKVSRFYVANWLRRHSGTVGAARAPSARAR